ncbi:unnamed protein product, partial [Symbiodinium microadriaticum]
RHGLQVGSLRVVHVDRGHRRGTVKARVTMGDLRLLPCAVRCIRMEATPYAHADR